jgi:hypothetical protein
MTTAANHAAAGGSATSWHIFSDKAYFVLTRTTRRPPHMNRIPDVRDGLTREERVVLYVLHETQKERGGRNVPTAMLWGRVCEHFYISPEDLSAMLARLGAMK